MSSITFFFIFIVILAIILLTINLIFAPHNPYKEKDSVFECGFHSFLGQNRSQFSISFFIFALLFLLFDIEILLVYPYVTSSITNEKYGLVFLIVFFLLLTLGFVFELGKDALKISSRQNFNTVSLETKYIYNVLFSTNAPKPHDFVNSSAKSSIEFCFKPIIFLFGLLAAILINAYFMYNRPNLINKIASKLPVKIKFTLKQFFFIIVLVIIMLTFCYYNEASINIINFSKSFILNVSYFLIAFLLVCVIFNMIYVNYTDDETVKNISKNFITCLRYFNSNFRIIKFSVFITIVIFSYYNYIDLNKIILFIAANISTEAAIVLLEIINGSMLGANTSIHKMADSSSTGSRAQNSRITIDSLLNSESDTSSSSTNTTRNPTESTQTESAQTESTQTESTQDPMYQRGRIIDVASKANIWTLAVKNIMGIVSFPVEPVTGKSSTIDIAKKKLISLESLDDQSDDYRVATQYKNHVQTMIRPGPPLFRLKLLSIFTKNALDTWGPNGNPPMHLKELEKLVDTYTKIATDVAVGKTTLNEEQIRTFNEKTSFIESMIDNIQQTKELSSKYFSNVDGHRMVDPTMTYDTTRNWISENDREVNKRIKNKIANNTLKHYTSMGLNLSKKDLRIYTNSEFNTLMSDRSSVYKTLAETSGEKLRLFCINSVVGCNFEGKPFRLNKGQATRSSVIAAINDLVKDTNGPNE